MAPAQPSSNANVTFTPYNEVISPLPRQKKKTGWQPKKARNRKGKSR